MVTYETDEGVLGNFQIFFYNDFPGIVINITAMGQLQAGALQNQAAALFGASPSTISKCKAKYNRGMSETNPKVNKFALSVSTEENFRL